MKLSNKGKKINASLTLAISAKAKELKAEGYDVIGFGAGEPDFATPGHISKAGKEAINKGFTNYTPTSGTVELKKTVQSKFKKENNLEYRLDQIIISNGAKHCLFNAFQAILNPGDEVIIPLPYWVSYPETVKFGGGVPVFLEVREENNFKLDINELKKIITDDTKALILNSPNNPTGCVYTKSELINIAELAIEKDFFVISDEIHEKFIYDDQEHISIASLCNEIKERTIVVNGMSKAYAMTGWRIGFAAGPAKIIKIMSNIQSHATSNPNSIAQYASTTGLNGPKDDIYKMVDVFKKRREYLINRIENISTIDSNDPSGTPFILICIEELIGKDYKGNTIDGSMSFADILLDQKKVAVVPGKAFGVDQFIRLSYAASLADIKKGLNRIEEFVEEIK